MYWLRVHDPDGGGGLCTQVFSFVNGLLLARAANEVVVVTDDFGTRSDTRPVDDVLDLHHISVASGLLVTAVAADQRDGPDWARPCFWADGVDRVAFNELLCNVRFTPRLRSTAFAFMAGLDLGARVNVMHVRNEPDAIERWAARNGMPPHEFEDALTAKYLAAAAGLSRHDTTLVLTGRRAGNPVIEGLRARGLHAVTVPPHADEGREGGGADALSAAVALLVGTQACTGALVVNVHPTRLNGSSFSYLLMTLAGGATTTTHIDLDHIQDTTVTLASR